ncbi:snake venom serine protease KN13-like [Drosophila eugracilis]|uniref:snake venom serine protease KN13-like n=1 Tax=Drosophila eugracilis TaxID=29029 RepID=UPI0007E6A757|nr:snake venom serine protease KN13-like [Drosophila eugracilis]
MVIESQSYRNITQEAMHSAVLSSTLFILILWNVAFCQFLDEKCHGRDTSMRQRIIGGRDATVNSTPWMAGIYNITKDFICGGSLITKTQIAPICIILDEGLTSAGIDRFAAYGWGKTHPNNREGSQILKVILLTRKNTQECYSRGEIVQPSDKLFCAGADGGDTCGGDSGGPLVSSTRYMERDIRVQFGIVSYGTLSCDGNGVYTDVMSYKNWIKTRTSGQFDEKLVLYDQCGSSWSGGVNIRLWEVSLFEQNFTGSLITDRK